MLIILDPAKINLRDAKIYTTQEELEQVKNEMKTKKQKEIVE